MNKAYEIYSERLPMMADHFVTAAQNHLGKYRIVISLQYSVWIRIYDSETDKLIFDYSSRDDCNRPSSKDLRFWHKGYCYEAESGSDVCNFSISNSDQVFANQILLERNYLEEVNFCFIDFERIFYEFLKSTFK